MEVLNQNRLLLAKRAFSTRRVPVTEFKTLLTGVQHPRSGDLVLARVTALGSHKNLELPTGRRAKLCPGDEIIVAFGNRYAPDQFEAYVPASMGPCHLAAAGGIAADVMRWHDRLSGPTEITPIGLLGNARGQAINLKDHALPRSAGPVPDHVFAVFGTSMNAGKTTTAAALVKGFHSAGYPDGAAKVTGTGAGGDLWMMRDFGATHAYDFTDAGHATTFRADPEALVDLTQNLLRTLGAHGCRVAVLEVADGLYQAETAALAASKRFRATLSGTFFAAGDAMGAVSGAGHLSTSGHNVLGVSGAFTRSPLAMEEVGAAAPCAVYSLQDLFDAKTAGRWLTPPFCAQAAGE